MSLRQFKMAKPSTSASSVGAEVSLAAPNDEIRTGTHPGATTSQGGTETGTYLDGQLHPLLNPVILGVLFESCPVELLATSKLVCKTWQNASLQLWRSNSTVKIQKSMWISEGPCADYYQPPLDDFLEYWTTRSCELKPHRQFHLQYWRFGNNSLNETRFWPVVGDSMTTLTLNDCYFLNLGEFRKLIRQCPNLLNLVLQDCQLSLHGTPAHPRDVQYIAPIREEHPKLRSLTVEAAGSQTHVEISFKEFWLEMFALFPNLTSFKLIDKCCLCSGIDAFVMNVVLLSIKAVRGWGQEGKLPLTRFEILPRLEVSKDIATCKMITLFTELGLPISQSIKFRLDCMPCLLRNLFRLHGPSIRKIEDGNDGVPNGFMYAYLAGRERQLGMEVMARIDEGSDAENEQFPLVNAHIPLISKFPFGVGLVNLEELIISERTCNTMEIVKYFPRLKRLRIIPLNILHHPVETTFVSNARAAELGHGANMTLPSLKELYLGYVVSEDDLKSLVRWLPNLEVLTMVLNNSQFTFICRNWRQLRHLHVIGDQLTDEGVTGKVKSTTTLRNGRVVSGAVQIRTNITALQNLTCFEVQRFCCRLTDESIYELLKLPNLERVHLSRRNAIRSGFGYDASTSLKRKLTDCSLWTGGRMGMGSTGQLCGRCHEKIGCPLLD